MTRHATATPPLKIALAQTHPTPTINLAITTTKTKFLIRAQSQPLPSGMMHRNGWLASPAITTMVKRDPATQMLMTGGYSLLCLKTGDTLVAAWKAPSTMVSYFQSAQIA
jgi:hypothetical protein